MRHGVQLECGQSHEIWVTLKPFKVGFPIPVMANAREYETSSNWVYRFAAERILGQLPALLCANCGAKGDIPCMMSVPSGGGRARALLDKFLVMSRVATGRAQRPGPDRLVLTCPGGTFRIMITCTCLISDV